MFYDTYLSLCNKAGKTPSGAALEIGLSKPTVNRWKNGGGATDANIKKIADYFGVPVSDLTGEKENSPALEGAELSSLQKEAMEFVLSLSDEQLRQFIRIGKAMQEE